VLRRRVLVWWLCAGVGCPVGLAFPLGGRRVGALLFCFQCRTARAARVRGHGLSVAVGCVGKSLTKGFKEEVRSLVPSSEEPIQRKK